MHSNAAFEADQLNASGMQRSLQQRGPPPLHHKEAPEATTDFGKNFFSVTPEPEEEDAETSEPTLTGKQKARICCRKFINIMLSHIGTLVIVICYVIGGGFLFNYLEAGNEISSCSTSSDKYKAKLFQTSDLVYAQSQDPNATSAQLNVLAALKEFANDVFSLNVDPSFNCSTYKDGTNLPNWNIVNAAYFCVTIVTTIGYGHITPVTQWGQIVCIVYGILGIPLMLLFLTKIGEPTAIVFRTFYLNLCCCKCFVKRLPHEARLMRELEAPRRGSETTEVEEGPGEKVPPLKVIEVDEDASDDKDVEEDNEVVNIPIIVTIMLLGIYVIIGACVFRLWEQWTIVEGAYFSFITLTTIGFGDLVPGRNGPFNETKIMIELMVGCIYCMFGLALLSMCINLIQDEISAKFQWIGTKLGINNSLEADAEEEEDEEEEEEEEEEDDDEDEKGGVADEDEIHVGGNGGMKLRVAQQTGRAVVDSHA